MDKIIKHRSTLPPFECEHCGYIWYGYMTGHRAMTDQILCNKCIWDGLDTFLHKKYNGRCLNNDDTVRAEVLADVEAWIHDKTQKPLPRTPERRFCTSVPKHIRSAITQGMMQTDGRDKPYVIYSEGDTAIKVEIVDKSTLKPFTIRQ